MTSGTDAVVDLVDETGWSYPISVKRLLAEHALANIELDEKGNSLTLSELVGSTDITTFEDEADLRRKVEPLVERKRAERRTGIIRRLIDLFT